MAVKRSESASEGLEGADAGDSSLQIRAEAARALIARGQITPEIGLSLVVWPTERLCQVPSTRRSPRPPEQREQVYELLDAGLSQPQIAAQTGIPFATVKMWSAQRRHAA